MLGNVQTHGLLYSPYNPIDHHHMSHLFLHGVHLSIFTPHIISIINIQFSQIYHNHMNNNNNTHRIHGAAIYGNMDPINIPPMLVYIYTIHGSYGTGYHMFRIWFVTLATRATGFDLSQTPNQSNHTFIYGAGTVFFSDQ